MTQLPLLIGGILSISIHAGLLCGKNICTPPKTMMEQGRTVVHLTLMPSVATQSATPEPEVEPPAETPAEPHQAEPVSRPVSPPEPAVEPEPKNAVESAAVAPEQNASPVEEKGVTCEAEPAQAIHPTYPRISQRRGEEGLVTLSVKVLANGRTGNISIIQSSGYRRLDAAAVNAVRATVFTPARQSGHNVDSTAELSFSFRLTDE